MTPPRGISHGIERPAEIRERGPEEAESSRDLVLVLTDREPVELDSLRRFSSDTALASRTESSLRLFQKLPQARLVVREPHDSLSPVSVLKRWHQVWSAILYTGESFHPVSMLRRMARAWRGEPLPGAPLEGITLLLGAGEERVRVDGDVTTLKFPMGEGSIQVEREATVDPSGRTYSRLHFSSDSPILSRYGTLNREGDKVFLRSRYGDGTEAVWLWYSIGGRWNKVDPQQPLLLKKGMVLAYGEPPSWDEIYKIPKRAREMAETLVAIESSPESDSIQVRKIQGNSLHYFLSGIISEADLTLHANSQGGKSASFDFLGVGSKLEIDRELLRLQGAKLLAETGYPREALRMLEIGESDLRRRLLDTGSFGTGDDSAKDSGVAPKAPEELKLRQAMVDLYERRAEILEGLQEPEAAAEAYAHAVEQLRTFLNIQTDQTKLNNLVPKLEWFSYRANILFTQKADRAHQEGNLAEAARAYESAAPFANKARLCQESTGNRRWRYANFSVLSEASLLEMAFEDYRQAGLSNDAERVKQKLYQLGLDDLP